MLSAKIVAFLAVVADLVFCGLLSNGLIIAVMVSEWAKNKSPTASEQLLLSLGTANICFIVLLTMLLTCDMTAVLSKPLTAGFCSSFTFCVIFMRYWLTAWLCVFYCIKILNSTHPSILWWKMRISRLVPRFIVGSGVIAFLASIVMAVCITTRFSSNGITIFTNVTQEGRMQIPLIYFSHLFLVIGSGCPLLLVLLCSILVISSLCRHVCQMRSKASNFRTFQTEAHTKAVSVVLSLLFLYIYFYVTQTVIQSLAVQNQPIFLAWSLAAMWMYSPLQGATLVMSNPKLKQTALRMFARIKL